MIGTLHILAVLVPLAILLRWSPWTTPEEDGPPEHREVLILAALAAVVALVCNWIQAPRLLLGATSSSDWVDVCLPPIALAQPAGTVEPEELGRLSLASVPAALFAPFLGVWNGIAAAALLGLYGMVLGIALWARALLGRPGALVALVLCAFVPGVAVAGRELTQYPQGAAGMALGAAAVAFAVRWPGRGALLLGGVGVGAMLAAQPIGVAFAAPAAVALLLSALRGPWRGLPVRLALPLPGILGSWWLASLVVPAQSKMGLSDQFARYVADAKLGNLSSDPAHWPVPEWAVHQGWDHLFVHHYVWGQGSPLDAIPGLGTVAAYAWLSASVPDAPNLMHDYGPAQAAHIRPWALPMALGFAAWLWTARRRPLELGLQLILVSPFLATAAALGGSQVWPKTLMVPSLLLTILMAALVCVGMRRGQFGSASPWKAAVLPALALAVLSFPHLPIGLSTQAVWRYGLEVPGADHYQLLWAARRGVAAEARMAEDGTDTCMARLRADLAAGHDTMWYPPALKARGW